LAPVKKTKCEILTIGDTPIMLRLSLLINIRD